MILTVTLNAALDVTYRVDALEPGAVHRIAGITERAGGKGVNVARILHALGEQVLATGLTGGATGTRLRDLLAADGVPEAFMPISGESRRTVVVSADDGATTGFWEPGPPVTSDEWQGFLARYRALLAGVEVVALCGSLPPGVPVDAYATLIGYARTAGVATVLDADGDPLRYGVPAGPDVVKPNAAELSGLHSSLLGRRVTVGNLDEALAAANATRKLGAASVVASLGRAGLLAVTGDGVWHARTSEQLAGNPTGAGDACVAALARGRLTGGRPWPDQLRDAVALGGASVRSPVAGEVCPTDHQRLRAAVTIEEMS
ncbi:1-phosphofructokinase family hexose kinase [Micromonospora sonneratiae]|uniref:1-phosphofructokinase family hexose kinase n=1 Tax=Micromonospora sonneratiae TaxID=1184706 RepID=A0ABW3YAK8_9ACTN